MESAVDFFSKCWVPVIYPGKSRFYYAYGNTPMEDLLADLKVSTTMDILFLGAGDVRHVLKTIAGLSTRPTSAGMPTNLAFHLNDCDCELIARDIVLMEIIQSIDAKNQNDVEYLWDIWYNMTILQANYIRLRGVLERLISGSYSQTWSFGDPSTKKQVVDCWQSWLEEGVWDKEKTRQNRLRFMKSKNFEPSTAVHFDQQYYSDTFNASVFEATVKFDKEFTDVFISGTARNGSSTEEVELVNPTMMRPGSELWHVHYASNPFFCYLPFQKKFLDNFTSLFHACLSSLQTVINQYKSVMEKNKFSIIFWLADAFVFCHQLRSPKMSFDYIHCSNLPDHVGLMNLLVTCNPLLKNSNSIIATETRRISLSENGSIEGYLKGNLGCNGALLPTAFGLRLATELDLGSDVPPTPITFVGGSPISKTFYFVKSLDEQTAPICFKESPDLQDFFRFATERCLCLSACFQINKDGHGAETPLTLIFIIKRLQNLMIGGIEELLYAVDLHISNSGSLSQATAWKTLCSAFSLRKIDDDLIKVSMLLDCNFPTETDPKLVGLAPLATIFLVHCTDYQRFQRFPELMSCMTMQSELMPIEVFCNYLFNYDDRKFTIVLPRKMWDSLAPEDTFILVTQFFQKSPCLKSNTVVQELICSSEIMLSPNNQNECICCEFNNRYEVHFNLENKDEKVKIGVQFTGQNDQDLHKTRVKLDVSSVKSNCYQKSVIWHFSCSLLPDSCQFQVSSKQHSIKANLAKDMEFFNVGRTAMPFRIIDKTDLYAFQGRDEVEKYFFTNAKMIDFTFTLAERIRQNAASNAGVCVQEPFFGLRETIAIIMKEILEKPNVRTRRFVYHEDKNRLDYCSQINMQMKGFFLFKGRPFVMVTVIDENKVRELLEQKKLTFREAMSKRSELIGDLPFEEACSTIVVAKDEMRLTMRLLQSNRLRLRQSRQKETFESEWYWDSYLQLLFPNEPWGTELPRGASLRQTGNYAVPETLNLIQCHFEQQFGTQSKHLAELENRTGQFDKNSTGQSSSCERQLNVDWMCNACGASNIATKKCTSCLLVSYCSKECQIRDWPQHKTKCKKTGHPTSSAQCAVDIASSCNKNEVKSRFVQACAACHLVKDNLKKCALCHDVSYCNKICQRADWLKHKTVCSGINKKDEEVANAEQLESSPTCCKCKLGSIALKRCTGCFKVYYCGKACQAADWAAHKPICQR